jgi:hypothetical protein
MRLQTSTLFNAYKRAIETNVAKVTSKNISVTGGSDQLQSFVNNVDTTGRSLNEFTKDLLRSSMNHGVSYILVDYPQINESGAAIGNPYFVDISAQQVISIRSTRVNGFEELIYFKYYTTGLAKFSNWDEETEDEVVETREYFKNERGKISFRVKQLENTNTGDHWITTKEGTMTGVVHIPIIPLYSNRTAFMMGEPLLQDLAELNIRHWQSSSDQQWVLHFARTPILFAKGMDLTDENGRPQSLNVGPNSVVTSSRSDADLKYVEHAGQAIASGQEDLKLLEDQMAVMGLDLSVDRTGNMTATGRAIDAAGADSILKSISVQLEDTLTTALLLIEMYFVDSTDFMVEVNKEYIPVFGNTDMEDIFTMWREGLISASQVLEEAKRRNVVCDKYYVDDAINTVTPNSE